VSVDDDIYINGNVWNGECDAWFVHVDVSKWWVLWMMYINI